MEDVSPTMMRDFFWDNDFRQVWDDMLVHTKTLEECMETGSEILHWVRKVCCLLLMPFTVNFCLLVVSTARSLKVLK